MNCTKCPIQSEIDAGKYDGVDYAKTPCAECHSKAMAGDLAERSGGMARVNHKGVSHVSMHEGLESQMVDAGRNEPSLYVEITRALASLFDAASRLGSAWLIWGAIKAVKTAVDAVHKISLPTTKAIVVRKLAHPEESLAQISARYLVKEGTLRVRIHREIKRNPALGKLLGGAA